MLYNKTILNLNTKYFLIVILFTLTKAIFIIFKMYNIVK